jgi:hypothetical protein
VLERQTVPAMSGLGKTFVRPRLSLRRVSRTRFAVTLVAGSSFSGKYVWISRYVAKTQRYFHVARIYLTRSSRTKTVSVGSAKIKVKRPDEAAHLPAAQPGTPELPRRQSNFTSPASRRSAAKSADLVELSRLNPIRLLWKTARRPRIGQLDERDARRSSLRRVIRRLGKPVRRY